MYPPTFEKAVESLRQANPDKPVGLLLPEALGRVSLGPGIWRQSGVIEVTPTDRLSFTLHCDSTELSLYNGSDFEDFYNIPHFYSKRFTKINKTSLGFSVRNTIKPYSNMRHPLFWPARLLMAAIKYHENQIGKPLDELTGFWWSRYESINFNTYYTVRDRHPQPHSEAAQTEAAFATWTGQQAEANDFTKVLVEEKIDRDHNGEYEAVIAHFLRS
ncbi:MAG TPA: hypothetical protein VFB59_05955 [Candidatus Saccharimonadales bacterium]|nr:hypothetical protein [Candidatus Saccharimonadales bacterium]